MTWQFENESFKSVTPISMIVVAWVWVDLRTIHLRDLEKKLQVKSTDESDIFFVFNYFPNHLSVTCY